MKSGSANDSLLFDYLLGNLSEDQMSQIEEKYLSESAAHDNLLAAETDLIDAYVRGELTARQRDGFENRFLSSLARRQKLRFAMALKDVLAKTPPAGQARSEKPAAWSRLRGLTRPPHAPARRGRFDPYLVAIASLLVVALVGAAIWRLAFTGTDIEKGNSLLASALKQRPLIPRITRDQQYARYPETRGSAGVPPDTVKALEHAETYFEDALERKPTADAHYKLGQTDLLQKKYDSAIGEFKAALSKGTLTDATKQAEIYNCLGVVWYEQGQAHQSSDSARASSLQDFAESLSAFNRALDLDHSLSAALFNRALLEESMYSYDKAETDWQEYLKRDGTSGWAGEARDHLEQVRRNRTKQSESEQDRLNDFLTAYREGRPDDAFEILSESYTPIGNFITSQIIDRYLASLLGGTTGTSDAQRITGRDLLKVLEFGGELVLQRTGDPLMSDLARFYSRVPGAMAASLDNAHRLMRTAYDLGSQSDYDQAIENYRQAERLLLGAGSDAESRVVESRIAHLYVLKPDQEAFSRKNGELTAESTARGYIWLLSRCLSLAAQFETGAYEYTSAVSRTERALKLSERLSDQNGVAGCYEQLAEEYRALNDAGRSLSYLVKGLAVIAAMPGQEMLRWSFFTTAGISLMNQAARGQANLMDAALGFARAALEIAGRMDRPLLIARSREYLAAACDRAGRGQEARDHLSEAFQIGNGLGTRSAGIEIMAHASLQLGDLENRAGRPDQGLDAYDRCIELYGRLGVPYKSYEAHRGRLQCLIAKGDDAAAESEVHTVMALFDRLHSQLLRDSHRVAFFNSEQDVCNLAVDFEYTRRHESDLAFDYSEMSRARSLLDMVRSGTSRRGNPSGDVAISGRARPLTLPQVRAALPPEVQLVEYAVLPGSAIAWVLSRNDSYSAPLGVSADALAGKIKNYVQLIQSEGMSGSPGPYESEKLARELYGILIRPLRNKLEPGKVICIVPDGPLYSLPFSALISGDGRYLVEDFATCIAPSASVFILCSREAQIREASAGTSARSGSARSVEESVADARALTVGNPLFDRSAFPDLPDLKDAETEAREVASLYPNHACLVGREATPSAVKREMVKSDVIDLAVHCLVNEQEPMRSLLLLAPESKDGDAADGISGALYASTIYELRLPRTRMVVLSACQTGVQSNFRGEGPISIARPFLAAGVPVALASAWAVDSNAAAKLMILFHRLQKDASASPSEALRQAQREFIHSEDQYRRPSYWAGFFVVGSSPITDYRKE